MRSLSLYLAALGLTQVGAYASTTFNLGIASPFAVFSGSAVTNTGATQVYGNVGVWPGNSITGFPPATFTGGTTHSADAMAKQAYGDMNSAFGASSGTPCGTNLSGQNLGGMTLTAGVYCFSSSAFLSGTLKLDAQGNPDAIFIFQTTNALTTGMGASVVFVNGGQAGNVLWAVGTSANIGASTSFAGDILAMGSITMNTGSSLQCGSALSINGQVSLDTNNISTCGTLAAGFADTIDAPEPSTASLLLLVGLPGLLWLHRRKRRRAQSES